MWSDQIRDTLYGLRPFFTEGTNDSVAERVRWRLENVVRMYGDIGQSVSQSAVVLEIDTKKLIELTSVDGLFPVLVSKRPIESIFTSLAIVPQAVKAVYVVPEYIEKMSTGNIPIKSLDEIDEDKWLGGVNWRKVNPTMKKPLSVYRYLEGNKKQATWWDIAKSGLIAPIKTIEQKAYGVPPMVLTTIFGRENFAFTSDKNFQEFPATIEDEIAKRFGIIEGVFNRYQVI